MRRKSLALGLATAFLLSASAAFAHEEYGPYFDDDGCGGTLSCTSEVVGDVIAFPFRLVANAVDFIF